MKHAKDGMIEALVDLVYEYGSWESIDTWGPGVVWLTEKDQTLLATDITDRMADIWDAAYAQGVADERTSEENIGIAGCLCDFGSGRCQCKIAPARVNPYRKAK